MIIAAGMDDFDDIPHGFDIESEATLRQRLAYDIVPDEMLSQYPVRFGLSPASPDVQEMEHRASGVRRAAAEPLMLLLTDLSRMSSELIEEAILVRHEETDEESDPAITPEEVLTASRAILATLLELGVVHLSYPFGVLQ